MTESVDVSVVIGFKDWGLQRLLTSVRSVRAAIAPAVGEVVVSDYGSSDGPVARAAVEAAGARYVYTPTDGTWSRSRALNAGFAVASGRVLISTDADMLFSPGSLAVVTEEVLRRRDTAVVLQCRDLPQEPSEAVLAGDDVDWRALERLARIRPRWGMGGMMAVPREAFLRVRGFDERMAVYGGEDIDFANRVRRTGLRLEWIERPDVRMYHLWHPTTRTEVSRLAQGRDAIAANRAIMLRDRSWVRNVPRWDHAPADVAPLLSVVIATRNRAPLLAESLTSVLAQTLAPDEIVVVDDGSTDDTFEVVKSFDDPRIIYVHQEHAGLAAARNRAADLSQGEFTAIHDDDDLMLPWRLEASVRALHEGFQGTYGGWIDFDDETGELTAHRGRDHSLSALLYSGGVFAHPTVLLRTDVLRRVRYDESLRSGSDYNLALRLARIGVRMRHTGEFHNLRRLHRAQVTQMDAPTQGQSARLTRVMVEAGLDDTRIASMRAKAKALGWASVRGADDLEAQFRPYLPDRLVRRAVLVHAGRVELEHLAITGEVTEVVSSTVHGVEQVWCRVVGASWRDLAGLRAADLEHRVLGTVEQPDTATALRELLESVVRDLEDEQRGLHWVCATGTGPVLAEHGSGQAVLRIDVQADGAAGVFAAGFETLQQACSCLATAGASGWSDATVLTRTPLSDELLVDALALGGPRAL